MQQISYLQYYIYITSIHHLHC